MIPKFCYEKAFWIVIAVIGSTVFAMIQYDQSINAQQNEEIAEIKSVLLQREVGWQKAVITYDNVLILCQAFDIQCIRFTP